MMLPMTTLEQPPKVFAVCSAVLFAKFLATSMVQGRKSFKAGTRCKEDMKVVCALGGSAQQNPLLTAKDVTDANVKRALEDEARWKRIVQNDVESIPIACVVFLGGMQVGASGKVLSAAMVGYTVARVCFTFSYAYELQPHRMICWMSGLTCIVTAAATGVIAALKK